MGRPAGSYPHMMKYWCERETSIQHTLRGETESASSCSGLWLPSTAPDPLELQSGLQPCSRVVLLRLHLPLPPWEGGEINQRSRLECKRFGELKRPGHPKSQRCIFPYVISRNADILVSLSQT